LLDDAGVPLADAAQADDEDAINHQDSAFWLAAL
jgi:hypothetical protein